MSVFSSNARVRKMYLECSRRYISFGPVYSFVPFKRFKIKALHPSLRSKKRKCFQLKFIIKPSISKPYRCKWTKFNVKTVRV